MFEMPDEEKKKKGVEKSDDEDGKEEVKRTRKKSVLGLIGKNKADKDEVDTAHDDSAVDKGGDGDD